MATRPSPAKKKSRAGKAAGKKPARPRKSYHHGNLREVLIAATLKLVEEGGAEAVTVREAARRADVSPGAPFRHFPNRTALMTAVAEEATHRLHAAIFEAVERAGADDPLARLRVLGLAYLRWAHDNPTHFAVASNRSLIDYDRSQSLQRENGEIQDLMSRLLEDAQRQGLAPAMDAASIRLAGRALVYGLARMRIDVHLPQWGVADDQYARAVDAVLDFFIAGVSRGSKATKPHALC